MTQENSSRPTESSELFDLLERFEQACQNGNPPDIVTFLPSSLLDPAARRELLLDLSRIDLEYRWRLAADPSEFQSLSASSLAPEPYRPHVEDYVARFPELGPIETVSIDLVADEYRARQLWGDRPSHDGYVTRFPAIASEVLERLKAVDQDIAALKYVGGAPPTDCAAHSPTKAWNVAPSDVPASSEDPLSPLGSWAPTDLPPLPKYGRYEVKRRLGGGTFAVVYLAYDPQLRRPCAVKVFRKTDSRHREMYLTEGRSVAKLDHPGLVRVYDVGEAENGACYVVMEYIEGQTLEDRLKSGPVSCDEAVDLVAQIADAVHHAHKQGFVHRDLKPANILLDRQHRPHVADFGLALHEDEQQHRAGEYAGTIVYSAPEQLRGEAHRLDGRADIWALGAILYEMLTGRWPFIGTEDAVRDDILNRDPKPPRMIDERIPKWLEVVCLKALSKSIPDRHNSAFDLASELRNGDIPSPPSLPSPSLRPRRWIAAAVGIVVCALVMGLIAFRNLGSPASSPDGPPAVPESADAVPESAGFAIRVWQNNEQHELAAALPVRSGDDVQIVCEVPHDLHPTIFWFDTEAKLHALTPELAERGDAVSRYVWPQSGKSNVLAGPAGTEVVLVCAGENAPPTLAELEPLLAGSPWPAIAARTMLTIDSKGVQLHGDRGPSGDSRDRPTDTVLRQCEELRQTLSKKYPLIRGVAFAHAEKPADK